MARFNKVLLALFVFLVSGCSLLKEPSKTEKLHYTVVERKITVDGDFSDWQGIKENVVEGKEHLWIGQDMTLDKWHGNNDLSFSWRAAWFGNKLYFLYEVTDDKLVEPTREYSWLNDCVEIYLDPKNAKGSRIEGIDKNTSLADRIGKKLRGYEMHFLPSSRPQVYLDDTVATYFLKKPQNQAYVKNWVGEVEVKKTPGGYLMEIGLSIPGLQLKAGKVLGIETAVCDDDGDSRKGLMLWTGKQVDFWISMDGWGEMVLVTKK